MTTDDICVRIIYSEVTHFSRNLIDQEICETFNPCFDLGFRVVFIHIKQPLLYLAVSSVSVNFLIRERKGYIVKP